VQLSNLTENPSITHSVGNPRTHSCASLNVCEKLWTRPTVEGHMGYKYADGQEIETGISGGAPGKTWPGDMWKTGGAATWLGGTYDAEQDLLFFGTGNPAPGASEDESPATVHGLTDRPPTTK
jgi:glucose dehydrogenase